MDVLRWVIVTFLNLYSVVLLLRVLASWIDPLARNPISRIAVLLTEPVLAPIRRLLPRTGSVDLAPLLLFLLLIIVNRIAWAIF